MGCSAHREGFSLDEESTRHWAPARASVFKTSSVSLTFQRSGKSFRFDR